MTFWINAFQVAAKMDRLKNAEMKLLTLAREFGDRNGYEYRISTLDTAIPRHVVPLRDKSNDDEELNIHAVRVESTQKGSREEIPLVMLHGYMNAAAYFYRNLVGLTHYFDTVYSLDMLGWGLSSRPPLSFPEGADEISATEDFFVESLEAWRQRNNIPKMILAGHSMGGYMSIAYCEKYPQHVEQLLLLSPVGVPEESEDIRERRAALKQNSWRVWLISSVAENIFHHHSGGGVLRSMPSSWGQNMFLTYVQKRMPSISDPVEQHAIAEFLVANNTLPGSGEHCLNKVLTSNAFAKRPMEYRIPHLKVPKITFLYGDHDWMDPKGGLVVQNKCQAQTNQSPKVEVFSIRNAGHLLMLENWAEFNAAVILGAGGSREHLPPNTPLPVKLDPNDLVQDQPSSLKQRSSTASLSDLSTTEPQIAN